MINKHSIYNWLFFPLFVSLLAGSVASCINDPAMEEDTSGKSTLSIMVRGVTTNPEQDGYDEYIETLRIIGFDAKGDVVCNQLFDHDASTDDVPDFIIQGTGEDTKINITQTLEEAFQGGTCDFYFIANEKDYTVYNTQSNIQLLSNFLDEVSLNGLKNCVIAYDGKEPGATNQRSILMTTSVTSALKPGDNIKIADVKLIRCVAKVQLIVQKDNTVENKIPENDVVTISDVSLHGTRPESYSLWNTKSHFATNSAYTHNFTITDGNKTVGYGTDGSPAYTSDMVYFPEKLYQDNTAEGDLYFTFTLTYTPEDGGTAIERTYTVAIGEDADKGGTVDDYNIYRNTVYTVTATLQWQPTEPTMNIQVDAWDGEVKVDVPDFE